jgi:hypothetical protein
MDSDPTPGDPDLIQGIVTRYRDIGDNAERALNLVKKDGGISTGKGAAMDKLIAKIGDDLPDKLTKTMTSYHDAAQAYADYIPQLRVAQSDFDQAVDRARAAAPQANQTPRQLSADATDEERAQARSTQDSIDAGQAEMSRARSLAEQAKAVREDAQRRCAEVLDRAAGEAIPERNVFQKIADFFKDFPFVQILVAIFAAVVAVFFPLAGVLLGGVLFVFNQVVASQTGGIKAGDFVTGLLGLIPGGSLLRVGGRAVEAIGSAVLPAAVKNSGLISQATGSISKIGETLTNSKVVGGFLSRPIVQSAGEFAGEVAGNFAANSAIEAASKAANHDKLTAEGILGGAAAGAVAGAAFKRVVGALGKGESGRFGDTAEPAVGDSRGKQLSDQLGSFFEEGATLGTKIGVGVAQGNDPKEVAAGEIANSASKIAVGAIGRAGLGHAAGNLTDKIPFKGRPRPDAEPTVSPDASPPSSPTGSHAALPVDSHPASPDVSPPSSPTGSHAALPVDSHPASPVDSHPAASDASPPSSPTGSHAALPDASPPSSPTGSHAASPVDSHPAAPDVSPPSSPTGSHPALPVDSHPAPPVDSHPASPDASPPSSPTGSHPASPVDSHPASPVDPHPAPPADSHPASPDVSPPSSPTGSHPATPIDVPPRPPTPVDPRPVTPVPVNPLDVPLPPSPTVPDGASAARPVVGPADPTGPRVDAPDPAPAPAVTDGEGG